MNLKLLIAAGAAALGLAACAGDVPNASVVIPDGGVRDGGVAAPDAGVPDAGAPDGGAGNPFTSFVTGLLGATNDTGEAQNIDSIAGADPDEVPAFDSVFE